MRPLVRTTLPGWLPAEEVVRALAPTGDVVWLDAGAASDRAGAATPDGYPERSLVGWGSRTLTASVRDEGAVEAAWATIHASMAGDVRAGSQDPDPLGWWGALGYGVAAATLGEGSRTWAASLGDPTAPDVALIEVDRALVFDHGTGTVTLVTWGEHDAWRRRVEGWWADAVTRGVGPIDVPVAPARTAVWRDTAETYLDLVDRCLGAIHDGDAFVMCLTTSVAVDGVDESDLDVYARLRRLSPAPRASFSRLGGVSLLSSSPETFLRVGRDGVVESAPIKGTRARSADPATDRVLAVELGGDVKERAENLMIVDLMRNDLSRIAVPGSVEVPALFEVRSYAQAHQLVSTVRARRAQDATSAAVVRAAFPPGSMTGAPKHSVVSFLAAWETGPRGLYSGAVGRLGFDGSVDLAVVIRSIVLEHSSGRATVGVGGGVTALSDPAAELEEVRTKARAPLAALGAVI
ncbi:anthranilate synthase component I family protein [Frondihabitans australicus]|uniref:Anthranilate synthase component 1 n=1 Tax=Frondihabitans australicus TaxID=386892 RepID=A0A495IFP5_9MICO|nr:anthranilate synthase component I family protein [Frondihabitans australicus]RKR73886.1 anthranilate synthase component 1 [Frondihabitans australicus]